MPSAFTAASRTSATSQRNKGTTSLYNATGDGEPVDDLSLRSAFNESGDELIQINKLIKPTKIGFNLIFAKITSIFL